MCFFSQCFSLCHQDYKLWRMVWRLRSLVALDTLEKEDRAVRPEKNTALLCRDETKREGNAKRTHCPPRRRGHLDTSEKEDGAVRPEKNTALLCRNETRREGNAKRTKRRPASFGISEETPYSGLPTADIRDHLLPDGSDPTRRTAQSKLISSR